MRNHRLYIWQKLSVLAFALGLIRGLYIFISNPGSGPVETFNYLFLAMILGWAGALAGGALDWARYRRSPLEPLFNNRFKRYYKMRYWLRFAIIFTSGWALFLICAVGVALAIGAKDEANEFFTIEGAALVVIFCFIFAFEGAVFGGLLDLALHLFKKVPPKTGG